MTRTSSYLLILFGLTLASCGVQDNSANNPFPDESAKPKHDVVEFPTVTYSTDPEFLSYLEEFTDEAEKLDKTVDLSKVPVTFGYTAHRGSRVVGYCKFLKTGQNLIVINKEFWNRASDWDRKSTLYHELGHCALYRAHRLDFRTDITIPLSLMYSFLVKEQKFIPFYFEYMEELLTVSEPSMKHSNRASLDEVVCSIEDSN